VDRLQNLGLIIYQEMQKLIIISNILNQMVMMFVNHVAKQFKTRWRSKLGASNIIEHELEWISGEDFSNYGEVGVIMKKYAIVSANDL
jgi:hypothetical protein